MNFRPNSLVPASVRALLRGTALSTLAVCVSTALAQVPSNSDGGVPNDANGSSGPANGAGLPEVIVTAEKRSQNLINVPASISVLTGTALTDQQITTADDLTRAVPGLSFAAGSTSAASAGVGSEGLVIRGIGSSAGLSATVGVYVDDVNVTQLSQAGNFSPMIFDLERVEVLRGPQGTVFGASAEGGTVRYITKQPNLNNFSGLASASVSHTEHGSFNTDDSLVLNIPLISNVLAIRVGGEFTDNSGWIDRYANEPNTILTPSNGLLQRATNLEHDYAVRVVAKYQ
ncbi:MAG: TonB-dependent receptor plug domain-containing protein, partial [Steroidobacteraceae bacterium]